MGSEKPNRNESGYLDLTASEAIRNIKKQQERVNKVVKTIKAICWLGGFELVGRVVIRDKDTGEIFR